METIPCPLIVTTRLKPYKQKFDRLIMTIAENGHVYIGLNGLMTGRPDKDEITTELMDIFPDGNRVEVYQNMEGVPTIEGYPMASQPDQVYTYPNMPEKLWKKYRCAYRFVELVKSRTAKIILVTDRAQCKLMENAPNNDFELCFFEGMTLVISNSKVTVTDKDGNKLTFDMNQAGPHATPNILALLEYGQQCRIQCLEIEKVVSDLLVKGSNNTLFPLTVGTSLQPFQLPNQPLLDKEQEMNNVTEALHPGNTQPSLNHTDFEARICKQPEVSTELDHRMKLINEPQTHHENLCQIRSEVCSTTVLHPVMGPYEVAQMRAEYQSPLPTNSFRNADLGINCSCMCANSDTTSTVLQSTHCSECENDITSVDHQNSHICLCQNSKPASTFQDSDHHHVHKNCLKIQQHSLPHYTDVIKRTEHNTLGQGNSKQYATGKNSQTCLLNTDLLGKFQKQCSMPQYYTVEGSSCNESREQLDLVPCSPLCKANNCDISALIVSPFTHSDHHQTIFSTPQKSTLSFGLPLPQENFITSKCQYTPLKYNSAAVECDKHLQAVRRNLFCDTNTKLPSSPQQSTFNTSVSQNDLLRLCPCKEDRNIKDTIINEQTTNLHSESRITHSDNISTVSILHLDNSSLATPSKTENSGDSFLSCSDHQARKASIFASEEHSYENSQMSYATSNNRTPNSAAATQLKTPLVVPEADTPQEKTVSLKTIANLSPEQISPTGARDQKNSIPKHTDTSITDLFHCNNLTSPAKSGSSTSFGSPCQSPSKTRSDITKEHVNSPLSRAYSAASRVGSWAGMDLPLSPHVRKSLDMSSDGRSSSPSSGSDLVCQVFVPFTGWASLYTTGTVWVLYHDGTQIGIKATETAMIYIDQDGNQNRYKDSDAVPAIVKLKLEKLPQILDKLMKCRTATFPRTLL